MSLFYLRFRKWFSNLSLHYKIQLISFSCLLLLTGTSILITNTITEKYNSWFWIPYQLLFLILIMILPNSWRLCRNCLIPFWLTPLCNNSLSKLTWLLVLQKQLNSIPKSKAACIPIIWNMKKTIFLISVFILPSTNATPVLPKPVLFPRKN